MEKQNLSTSKAGKIIYWIATIWLALGMTVSGVFQLMKGKEQIDFMATLGYPAYMLNILGGWKIIGVIVLLIPKFPIAKEWAYAGFFFTATGAIYSLVSSGRPMSEIFGPVLLVVLTIVSWYLRPADRKVTIQNK